MFWRGLTGGMGMAGDLKAIETRYAGCRFRSRLEARWAVFFDHLGVKWEYEKEGYDLGAAGWYLPDFWLPEQECWVEIKPDRPTSSDRAKFCALVDAATSSNAWHPLLVFIGTPREQPHIQVYDHIPDFTLPNDVTMIADNENAVLVGCRVPACPRISFVVSLYPSLVPSALYPTMTYREYPYVTSDHLEHERGCIWDSVRAATIAAKSARFEHGESG